MEVTDKITLLPDGSCNTYFINDGKKVLIDAGATFKEEVDIILLTHAHPDHVSRLKELMTNNPEAKVYVNIKDLELLSEQGFEINNRFQALYEGKTKIECGKYSFEVMEVSAHTKGSVIFYDEKNKLVFTGDTLFKDGIGRTDFPESNPEFMDNAIALILGLDFELALPGHGEPFTPNDIEESSSD